MTFNNLAPGQLVQASKFMENYRHVNYGNALLPVDTNGAGVDDTIDLGSSSYQFRDLYLSQNLTVGGEFSVANQPILNIYGGSATFTNTLGGASGYTVAYNIGAFTISTTKIYVPSAGVYRVCAFGANMRLQTGSTQHVKSLLALSYNSSNTLKMKAYLSKREEYNGTSVNEWAHSGQLDLYVEAGGYIVIAGENTETTSTTFVNVGASILKVF